MKVLVLLILTTGLCAAQFGFGGFDSIADSFVRSAGKVVQTAIKETKKVLNSVPVIGPVLDFEDFVKKTGKTYADTSERAMRKAIFERRKKLVDEINAGYEAGTSLFLAEINAFADLTIDEYHSQLTGNKKSVKGEAQAKLHRANMSRSATYSDVPSDYDWREKGGVTPVKYQGECGSCWSFAVTGAIEGHIFRKTGKLSNFSEQNLIDCGTEDYGLAGCDGGFQDYGFEFVMHQEGIAEGEKYPYLYKKNICSYRKHMKAQGVEMKRFVSMPPQDEEAMEEVVSILGPLACSINSVESLLLYKSGIYSDKACNEGEVNHSVLVVGYGSEMGHSYWIVKNSWDTAWGEGGFFKLPRGKNFCGIATECSYPIV